MFKSSSSYIAEYEKFENVRVNIFNIGFFNRSAIEVNQKLDVSNIYF